MKNDKVILWDLMKVYFSYCPHIHAILSKISIPEDKTFILTPYTQEAVDQMVDIFTSCTEEGDLEHMVRMFIGALETVEYATQIAALLSNIDYSAVKESCDKDVSNLKQLIEQKE